MHKLSALCPGRGIWVGNQGTERWRGVKLVIFKTKLTKKNPPTNPTVAKCAKGCESVALCYFHGKLEGGKEPELGLCRCQTWALTTKTTFLSGLLVGKGRLSKLLKILNLKETGL